MSETRWWRAEDRHLYTMTLAACHEAYRTSATRLEGYARALRFYADKTEVHIGSGIAEPSTLDFNLVRTLVQSARARVVEYPAPRPQIQTSGGNPEVQKRAQGLTKWMAGLMSATKYDALVRGKVALRSGCLGDGVVKYGARFGRPHITAPKPWHLFAHEEDEQEDDVRTLYQVERIDRGVLAHLYPEEARRIDHADGSDMVPWGHSGDNDHKTTIIEAWHLPSSPDAKDGRHVLLMQDKVLADDPWTHDTLPFGFLRWCEPMSAFWATGIADEVGALQWRINKLVARLQEAIDLTCNPRLLVPRGSKVSPWPPTNESGAIVYYSGPKAPDWDVARAVSPALAENIERLWAKGFQIVGESEMAAMAMKPAGIDSGEALRVYHDKTSGRRAPWSVLMQGLYTDAGDQLRRLGERLAAEDPDYEVVYHDQRRGQIERVRFSDVNLDRDSYVLRAYPVSSLPEDPAGRQAALDERMKMGGMTREQYLRLQRNPDLEADDELESAPYNLARDSLERMIYGDGTYTPPQGLDDLQTSLTLTTRYYAKARLDNVDPERLALVRQYAAALKVEIQKTLPPAPPPGTPPAPPAPPAPPL